MKYKNINYALALTVALINLLYAQSGRTEEDWIFENKGGLNVESPNGNFTFRILGRIQVDVAFYDQDVSDLGSSTELRRARFGAQGTFFKDWGFKTEFDFAGEDVTVADVYLQYLGFDPVVFIVGHFKQPFSLDNMTSANDITFM